MKREQMMIRVARRALLAFIVLGIVAAISIAMLPKPVRVDLAEVTKGPLQVTVDEDGRTRIRERYIVSAPLAGRLLRINKKPGDTVSAASTRLASIEPSDPQLLNPRELASAEAREKEAEIVLQRADPVLQQSRAELEFAESELGRIRKLRTNNARSQVEEDRAELAYRTASEAFRSATFAQEIAKYELEQARAALLPARATATEGSDKTQESADDEANRNKWRFEIESPIDGRVLRVFQESAAVVTPGTPLIEIGDPTDLELEIDVLSSDAVRIAPGNQVFIEHWGGSYPLQGRVRLVEPSAFTKISALGVEEQRVNVIIDLLDPVDRRQSLGDGFRVEVRIVVWQRDEVLRVPVSALFRESDRWYVFLVRDNRASRIELQLGERNELDAEVISGLNVGDRVIVHPADTVAEGVEIEGSP